MKKRPKEFWLTVYAKCSTPVFAILASLITFSNTFYLVLSLIRPLTEQEQRLRLAYLGLSIISILFGLWLVRITYLDGAIQSLKKAQRELYFHGYTIEKHVETQSLKRLQKWIGSGMCYELSILTMLQCKDFKSAKLCRGRLTRVNNPHESKHSLVEIKIPWNGWFTVDFTWDSGELRSKRSFMKRFFDYETLITEWECSYQEFWDIEYSKRLYEAISCRDTSHILNSLVYYSGPNRGYSFHAEIYRPDLKVIEQDYMTPQTRIDADDRPISDDIISFFVENPERDEPSHNIIIEALDELALRKRTAIFRSH